MNLVLVKDACLRFPENPPRYLSTGEFQPMQQEHEHKLPAPSVQPGRCAFTLQPRAHPQLHEQSSDSVTHQPSASLLSRGQAVAGRSAAPMLGTPGL